MPAFAAWMPSPDPGAADATTGPALLVAAARAVVAETAQPSVLGRVVDTAAAAAGVGAADASFGEPLTETERRVVGMLDGTLTEREIARELHLSHNTVRTYRRRLYRKLGVTSRAEAVAAARRG